MSAVAYTVAIGFPRRVTIRDGKSGELTEAQRMGIALRSLRRRRDLSQAAAAELANTHQQTWQRYEAGENDALLKTTLQKRVATALGATWEDLLSERANLGDTEAPAVAIEAPTHKRSRRFEIPVTGMASLGIAALDAYHATWPETIDIGEMLGDDARVVRLGGDSMIPYAEPGGFVTYNLHRYPRRHQGCVVELVDGRYFVKRYDRVDEERLYVTEMHPVQREISFNLEDVKGVYAVGLRSD